MAPHYGNHIGLKQGGSNQYRNRHPQSPTRLPQSIAPKSPIGQDKKIPMMKQINHVFLIQKLSTMVNCVTTPNLSAMQMLAILFMMVILYCLPSSGWKVTTPILLLNHCFFASLRAIGVLITILAVFKSCDYLSDGAFSATIVWLDGAPLPPRHKVKPFNTRFLGRTNGAWNTIATIRRFRGTCNGWYSQCRDILYQGVAPAPSGMSGMPGSFPGSSTPLPTMGTRRASAMKASTRVPDPQTTSMSDPKTNTQVILATRPIGPPTVTLRALETLPSNRQAANRGDSYRYIIDYTTNRPAAHGGNTHKTIIEASVYNMDSLLVGAGDLGSSRPSAIQPLPPVTDNGVRTSDRALTGTNGLVVDASLPANPDALVKIPNSCNRCQYKRKMGPGSNYFTMSFGKSRSSSLHRVERRNTCKLASRERLPAEQALRIQQWSPPEMMVLDTQEQLEPEPMDWEPSGCPILFVYGTSAVPPPPTTGTAGEGPTSSRVPPAPAPPAPAPAPAPVPPPAPPPAPAPTLEPKFPKETSTGPGVNAAPKPKASKQMSGHRASTSQRLIRLGTSVTNPGQPVLPAAPALTPPAPTHIMATAVSSRGAPPVPPSLQHPVPAAVTLSEISTTTSVRPAAAVLPMPVQKPIKAVAVTAPAATTATGAATVLAATEAPPVAIATAAAKAPAGQGRLLEKRERDVLAKGQHIKEPTGLGPERLAFLRQAAATEVAKIDPSLLTADSRDRLVVYYTQLYHLKKLQQK